MTPTGFDPTNDDRFMRLALEQAQLALAEGEVPVGAVIVDENRPDRNFTLFQSGLSLIEGEAHEALVLGRVEAGGGHGRRRL